MPRKHRYQELKEKAAQDPVFAEEWKTKRKAEDKARRDAKHTPEYLAEREWRRAHPEEHRKNLQRKHDARRKAERAAYRLAHPRIKAKPYKDMTPEERKIVNRREQLRISGWTPESFENAKNEQCGRCAICGDVPEPMNNKVSEGLVADHKHGEVPIPRALLCPGCNAAIGLLKDSPERCESAATYLRKYS